MPAKQNLSERPRVLVLGDDYMSTQVFAAALAAVSLDADIDYVQLRDVTGYRAVTESEGRIREFFGEPSQVLAALDGHSVLLLHGAPVTAEVMAAAPELTLIGCARGGPVNVDVAEATKRGIAVVNTPGKNAAAVADLTLAFLLQLARGLITAMDATRESGRLSDSTFAGVQFIGRELAGQTLGLVGLGSIGRLVAARALAFEMTVVASDPYIDPAEVPSGVRLVGLDELLASSDFVSLHARAMAENRHLVGRAQLQAMKPSAFLINTARESLVDEAALIQALDAGEIAGAALDVVESPSAGRHPLVDRDDVIVTPHIGGATHETLVRGAQMLVADLARHLAGDRPLHLLNPQLTAVLQRPL